jgi:para-nitrobenzyl esterase
VEHIVVETKSGVVRGERLGPVLCFRGLPFASPPVGPLRFEAPRPLEGWSTVRDATAFGPVAMQVPTVLELERGMPPAMSEDCLTLNIWAPEAVVPSARLPVLVWIHGGSFLNGSGSMSWFDGSVLAARGDVVVVTVNYRLGVFGYLHLAGIDGDRLVGSANAGLLDQVAALRWVHDNVAAFGGDPELVCVVGESAGAMSIGTLLGTPAAAGLFQRAILQSGTPVAQPVESAQATAGEVLDSLGVARSREGIASMSALDAGAILTASAEVTNRLMLAATQPSRRSGFMWSPVIDGTVVPDDPWGSIGTGPAGRVPVLIGTTADEMRILRRLFAERPAVTQAQFNGVMTELFGTEAAQAADAYRALSPDATVEDLFDTVASDRIFGVPTDEFVNRRAAGAAPTWSYRFDWKSTAEEGRYGAAHTVEIPFVFGTFDAPGVADFLGPVTPEARALAGRVQDAWVSFARDGAPSVGGLPRWPGCTGVDRPTMVLDEECRVVQDAFAPTRAIWRLAAP